MFLILHKISNDTHISNINRFVLIHISYDRYAALNWMCCLCCLHLKKTMYLKMFVTFLMPFSYTLECNYNTGRMVNPVPTAYGDDGRATPPPLAGFPPKYTQAHFEEVSHLLCVVQFRPCSW